MLTLVVLILVGRAIDGIVGAGAVRFDVIWPLLWADRPAWGSRAGAVGDEHRQQPGDLRRGAGPARGGPYHINHLPLANIDAHPRRDGQWVIADADQLADGPLRGFTQLFRGTDDAGHAGVHVHPERAYRAGGGGDAAVAVRGRLTGPTPCSGHSPRRGEQTAFIDERIGNLKAVQAYGRQAEETAAFDAINERLRDCSLKATFYSSLTNPSTRFVNWWSTRWWPHRGAGRDGGRA